MVGGDEMAQADYAKTCITVQHLRLGIFSYGVSSSSCCSVLGQELTDSHESSAFLSERACSSEKSALSR